MIKSAEIPLFVASFTIGVLLERTVDPYLPPWPSPVILKAEGQGRTNPNSSFDTAYGAWLDLQKPAYTGIDGVSRSFVEVMQTMGYQVGTAETFGSAPRLGRAGREGSYIRVVPSTLQGFGIVGGINWGEKFYWNGEFPVSKPDNSTDIFGLTGKGYVRLGTRNPDGTITWYVEWADGSRDYGNEIIGPSTADMQPANRK